MPTPGRAPPRAPSSWPPPSIAQPLVEQPRHGQRAWPAAKHVHSFAFSFSPKIVCANRLSKRVRHGRAEDSAGTPEGAFVCLGPELVSQRETNVSGEHEVRRHRATHRVVTFSARSTLADTRPDEKWRGIGRHATRVPHRESVAGPDPDRNAHD